MRPSRRSEDIAAKTAVGGLGRRKEIVRRPLHRAGLERLQEIFMTEELLDACQVAKLMTSSAESAWCTDHAE